MTDKTDLIREIHEYVTTHGGENTATHLLVQAASVIQTQAAAPTMPEGWTDCTIEFGNDGPEVVAYGPKRMMNRLAKWLGKYFAQVIADAAPKAAPGDGWLQSGALLYRLTDDRKPCNRDEIHVTLADGSRTPEACARRAGELLDCIRAAPQQEAQEPATAPRFNCWSTNEGDSWFDHPADAQAIYDCLGNDAKVGDEYELTAGWKSVTARYRITEVVGDGEDYEVECISHPQGNTAPQQEAQEPTEIPEAIAYMAAERYKVVPSHESMFHRWAVVAGTGTQQLYLGHEVECQNMARKFAGAFLDGAFVAMQQAAPKAAPGEPGLSRQDDALCAYLADCDDNAITPDVGGAFAWAWAHASVAAPQQEAQWPIGWTTGIAWRSNTRLQSEQVVKITRDAQPMYGYTTPLYTAPQPAPAPMSDEIKLLKEARAAIWQPANAELCERIDAALAAQQQ